MIAALLVLLLGTSGNTADEVRAAQQLAWQQRFGEAEAAYRRALANAPSSREALLGLGQVLAWERRHDDSMMIARQLLARDANDADARKLLATAEYWSGDYRNAQRDYARLLELRPNDGDARSALAAIASTMRTIVTTNGAFVRDDQPLRRATVEASATLFSDPLTTWTAAAGTHALQARQLGFGRATAPFASLGGETALPSMHLRASGTLRLLRFPDDRTSLLGRAALTRDWRGSAFTAAGGAARVALHRCCHREPSIGH